MTYSLLNVGGHSKAIPLPPQYDGWTQVLLDIDPSGHPDVVCDARQLDKLPARQYDAVYCAHNLEHYYHHEVPRVLAGFRHVLKPEGFVQLRVPDLKAVMQTVVQRDLDVEDVLYTAPIGSVRVRDVIYGYDAQIEQTGEPFFAHKTGFTRRSLQQILNQSGFPLVYTQVGALEILAYAFTQSPSPFVRSLLGLPTAATPAT